MKRFRQRARKRVLHQAPTGPAIRALRERCAMTQYMFARQLDVTPNCIIQWEQGYRVPAPTYAAKLYAFAAINGVDLDQLGEQATRTKGMELPA